jgi:hypothetical protein
LAVKDNFKGVWDGAGKVVTNFLWRLEQQKTRTATAFDCFVNTKNEEFEFDDRQIRKRYEETNNPYLLQKNTFTYTRRIVGLVVDTEAEYNHYSSLYPGCIVYADRREVLTLTKSVRDTKKQSQVAFCKKTRGADFGFLNLEEYPCRCTQCRNCLFDVANVDGCPFKIFVKPCRSQRSIITIKKTKGRAVDGGNNSCSDGDRDLCIP